MRYIGVDGCKLGWFYVGLDDARAFRTGIIRHVGEITEWLEQADLILIDIPIGLLDEGTSERLCDLAARKMIKPRGSTVFPAPARSAIAEETYEAGSAENYRRLGRKLSKQSWAISPRIREVDDFLRTARPSGKVREMHPEVAFCALNGGLPVMASKKSRQGFDERLRILERYYPDARSVFEAARKQTPLKKHLQNDDILDALAGVVTASYHPNLLTLPADPPIDSEGLPMEIVYAQAG